MTNKVTNCKSPGFFFRQGANIVSHLLKTTCTTGSDPSFLISDIISHLALESLILLLETLLRNSLKIANEQKIEICMEPHNTD